MRKTFMVAVLSGGLSACILVGCASVARENNKAESARTIGGPPEADKLERLVQQGNIAEAERYAISLPETERQQCLTMLGDAYLDSDYLEQAARCYADASDVEGSRKVAAAFFLNDDFLHAASNFVTAGDTEWMRRSMEAALAAPKIATITGIVADASQPYGSQIGIPQATISYHGTKVVSDTSGHFKLTPAKGDEDPVIEMKAPGFRLYREKLSRAVNGAFHLIPEKVYRGVFLICWHKERPNPHNWLRKWETQTEFVIVRNGASEAQVDALQKILASDAYRKLTGGRFTSKGTVTVVDEKPNRVESYGKTIISFNPTAIGGGEAYSDDKDGSIYYAEIRWNTKQVLSTNSVWHEMVHTVTAGGHINEWPSIVSEVQGTDGVISSMDEQIFNCIYNSPPLRDN